MGWKKLRRKTRRSSKEKEEQEKAAVLLQSRVLGGWGGKSKSKAKAEDADLLEEQRQEAIRLKFVEHSKMSRSYDVRDNLGDEQLDAAELEAIRADRVEADEERVEKERLEAEELEKAAVLLQIRVRGWSGKKKAKSAGADADAPGWGELESQQFGSQKQRRPACAAQEWLAVSAARVAAQGE